jgi:phospholipase C
MNNPDRAAASQPAGGIAGLLDALLDFLRRLFQPSRKSTTLIEHVVLLMYENRSFDHMLGFLPRGGGLTGDEFNLVDPANLGSEQVKVNKAADYITRVDPGHEFLAVHTQLYGGPGPGIDPAPMSGFVKAYIGQTGGDLQAGKKIMECFDPQKLPALSTLAQEFCLCNRWFSSIPGPTWPNRFFVHAATSDGKVINDPTHLFDMKTIYDSLSASGVSWNIYYNDIPHSLALERLWTKLDHFKPFHQFRTDVKNGALASYTFIEPRYFSFFEWKANDQHPPHDMKQGEYLLAELYETIRNSPLWEKTLLVVLFDEHGGFYDQISPPGGVPNPDGQNSGQPPFDFTHLGVRVPAILVSPYIEKGVIDSTVYEHSSVAATLKRVFNLPAFLTARDAAASSFEKNLTRSAPRTDAPLTLPLPGTPAEIRSSRQLLRSDSRARPAQGVAGEAAVSQEPLSEFQETLVVLADRINARDQAVGIPPAQIAPPRTEQDGAQHVQDAMRRLRSQ